MFIAGVWLGLVTMPASAQIYKWFDDKGNLNYGDKPPNKNDAQELDAGTSTLSVYEAPKYQQPGISTGPDASSLARKVDSLERQLELERQARRNLADAEARYDPCSVAPGCGYAPWPVTGRSVQRLRAAPGLRKNLRSLPAGKA